MMIKKINMALVLFTMSFKLQAFQVPILPENTPLSLMSCDMLRNGEYLVLSKCIKNGDTVFDVGAHKGEWSTYASTLFSLNNVYAFEPIPNLYKELNLNKKWHVFPYAISAKEGMASLTFYETIPALTSLYNRFETLPHLPYSTITVPTITLDIFCQKNGIKLINFLKIDTEGSELDVLKGSLDLLTNRAINYIQFEYGGTYRDAKITLKEVYALLRNHGYEVFYITQKGLIPIMYWRDSLENYEYSNFLAVSKMN